MKSLKRITVLLLLLVTNLVYAQGVYVPYTIVNGIVGIPGTTQANINDQDDATFYGKYSYMFSLKIKPNSEVTSLKFVANDTIIGIDTFKAPLKAIISLNLTNIDTVYSNQLNTLNLVLSNGQLITELKEGNFKLENNFIYILNVLVGDDRLSKKIVLR